MNDNCAARFGIPGLRTLPKAGAHALCNQQQADLLLNDVRGDRRSLAHTIPAFAMGNGESREVPPLALLEKPQAIDTIRATLSSDQQAIQVELTCAKGTDREAPHSVAVPLGSHLLVCTANTIMLQLKTDDSPSFLENLKNRLTGSMPRAVGMQERLQVYLLVTPRIAWQEP